MGLMEHVSGMAITLSVTDHIRVYILDTCRGDFETSFLDHLEMVCTWIFHTTSYLFIDGCEVAGVFVDG